jgi:hypothetical protein
MRALVVSLAALALLAACGAGGEEPTATLSADQIQTEAVETYAAFLTATAQAVPSETPTTVETPTPSATDTAAATSTAAATTVPTSSCYGLTFVSDVTIPDNSKLAPDEQFTKTWRVRNSGSCVWDSGFAFRFTGGEAMGGTSVTLEDSVLAGRETDLSVELTAPETAGTYRGNWRMTTASGSYFGDEVYVLIVVGDATVTPTVKASASPTVGVTPSATPSPTDTPSETPEP